MKIPKELKKKTHQLDRKTQISNIFRKTFLELNKNHKPTYAVDFKKIGESGKYSDQVLNWLGGYDNLETADFILMAKEYNQIELYLNWERLGVINFRGKPFYHLNSQFDFFKNLYEQLAYHEYGHTFFIISTSTMFFPEIVLDYLKKKDVLYFSELSHKDYKECEQIMNNCEEFKRDNKLQKFKYIDVANGVGECHANYSVFTRLREDVPQELLKFSRIDLLDGLHDYRNFNLNILEKSYLNRRIINWIVKSSDFLVYNKWHIVEKDTEQYGFASLSKLAFEINTKFLDVAKNDDDLNLMKKKMLDLAEEIDKLDFIEMVFQ